MANLNEGAKIEVKPLCWFEVRCWVETFHEGLLWVRKKYVDFTAEKREDRVITKKTFLHISHGTQKYSHEERARTTD